MESFAQTGAQQDDLFNDFTNGEESMQTRAQDDLFGDDFTPATEPERPEPTPPAPQESFQRGGRGATTRGRGRGRGRGGGVQQNPSVTTAPSPAFNPLGESRHAPNPLGESKHAPKPPVEPKPATDVTTEVIEEDTATSDPPLSAPTEPKNIKPTAVRGDRSATGGTSRAKLTEEELAARISSIQLKNATLEAAHARAQADADSFAQRENEAAKKRKEERRDRQQMMGEREKNRLRKLKAQEGREWDSEKREEDFSDRRRGYGRGAHGGVAGTRLGEREVRVGGFDGANDDGREYIYREDRGRGRGRGGRGGRGDAKSHTQAATRPPKAEEFPALAAAGQTVSDQKTDASESAPRLSFPAQGKVDQSDTGSRNEAGNTNDAVTLGEASKQSWADMVEDSKAR
ncbi:Hypothetical protein D9617_20g028490 [Elsinoe fawcettii]|nr:Hypothetical protein D9617_20g028490 [Elsinoe fawcettii]